MMEKKLSIPTNSLQHAVWSQLRMTDYSFQPSAGPMLLACQACTGFSMWFCPVLREDG